jgi:hypothetical protein
MRPAYKHPRSSITRKSRLLCPECKDMRRVKNVSLNPYRSPIVTLECGHKRGEILPSQKGSISIETFAGLPRKRTPR